MGQAAFAQVALKDTHSLLPLHNCSLSRPLTVTVTVTPIRQGCFQETMLRCGDTCQCAPSLSWEGILWSPSLYLRALAAAHAHALPLSSVKPAVRVEQELGESTHDFWVPPLRYNGGTVASARERKTGAGVSRVRTVVGWHDKGGMEAYMGRKGTVAGSNSEGGMQLTFSCGKTTPSATQRNNQLAGLG